jgi:hypothetical protein
MIVLEWWFDYFTALNALLGIRKASRRYHKANNVYYLDLTFRKKVA